MDKRIGRIRQGKKRLIDDGMAKDIMLA